MAEKKKGKTALQADFAYLITNFHIQNSTVASKLA